jgi:hypothetical protein
MKINHEEPKDGSTFNRGEQYAFRKESTEQTEITEQAVARQ